jgi:hypothetical protein
MQTKAIARKRRKTPMGRTGIAGLRLYLTWLDEYPTLLSAKAQPGGISGLICVRFNMYIDPNLLCHSSRGFLF